MGFFNLISNVFEKLKERRRERREERQLARYEAREEEKARLEFLKRGKLEEERVEAGGFGITRYHKKTLRNLIGSIVILAIAVIVFYFAYNVYKAEGLKTLFEKGKVELEDIGVTTAGKSFWYKITHLDEVINTWAFEYASWKNPTVKAKATKGIIFTSVTEGRDFFEEGKIDFYIEARVNGPEKGDGNVSFFCSRKFENESLNGEVSVDGYQGSNVIVEENQELNLRLSCDLPSVSGLEEDRSYNILIVGSYTDFITRSRLKVYNIRSDKRGEDYFEFVKDKDVEKGRVNSECVEGCGFTLLSLKTSVQPQTEIGSYNVEGKLNRRSDWNGKISNVRSILLRFPENFEVLDCEGFNEENGFMRSSEEFISLMNQRISKDENYEPVFICEYKINEPRELEGQHDDISASVVYDYSVEKKDVFNVRKKVSAV